MPAWAGWPGRRIVRSSWRAEPRGTSPAGTCRSCSQGTHWQRIGVRWRDIEHRQPFTEVSSQQIHVTAIEVPVACIHPRVEQDGHCVFVDRLACVDPIRPSSKRDQQCRADLKPRQHQRVALDSADPRQTGGSLEGFQESAHRWFDMGSITVATSHLSPPLASVRPAPKPLENVKPRKEEPDRIGVVLFDRVRSAVRGRLRDSTPPPRLIIQRRYHPSPLRRLAVPFVRPPTQ